MPAPLEQLLEVALLSSHLICVNLAAGIPILWMLLEFFHRKKEVFALQVALNLGGIAIQTLILGGLIGLIMGWLRWSSEYQALLLQTGSRLWFAIAEWTFSLVILTGCWLSIRRGSKGVRASYVRTISLLLASSNLLYHFPAFFGVLDQLRESGDTNTRLDSPTFRQLVLSPLVVSRSTHFIVSSIAVSGLCFSWSARRLSQGLRPDPRKPASQSHPADSEVAIGQRYCRLGLHLALWSTVGQFLLGFWLLISLPRTALSQMTGQNGWMTIALILGLLAASKLVHQLMRDLFRSDGEQVSLRRSVAWMFLTVLAMSWMSVMAFK